MKFGRRIAHFFLMVIILAIVLVGTMQSVLFIYFSKHGPLVEQKTMIIRPGMSLVTIGQALSDAGIIRHPLLFDAAVKTLRGSHLIKAGEYAFTPGITPRQIADMMIAGKAIIHRLTIPEGTTTSEILDMIRDEKALTGPMPEGIREGDLLPETYFFSYGDQRQQLIERMSSRMKHILQPLWQNRADNLPFTTPAEAVVLASIVEKETGIDKERPHVAAIFINRLRKGMKLQSDPTVIYALTLGQRDLGRMLTRDDLRIISPFNTYVIDGLPPLPIDNPGKASIEAVLNPIDSDDLYFVADGKGGHNFAATLAQHNRNVQKYRENLK